MITSLHHVAVLTSNLEEAIKYYLELLGCQSPRIAEFDKPGVKLRSAMLPLGPSGATYLQILEPHQGPGVKELADGGEGTLFEMAFQVNDVEEFAGRMKAKGIPPSDIAERPIKEKYIESKFGNRYFILAGGKTRGARIEIVQVVQSAKS